MKVSLKLKVLIKAKSKNKLKLKLEVGFLELGKKESAGDEEDDGQKINENSKSNKQGTRTAGLK